MIKCFVVDDEEHNIRLLSGYIRKTPGLELVGAEENPLVALEAITSGKAAPDIVFVDVDMPELTGVELEGLINRHTEIVFATAFPDYALQAFEKNAIDYLVKPISYERFLQAVSKARSRMGVRGRPVHEDAYFFIKSDMKGKVVKVEYGEIVYVEALQNYVKIHVRGGSLVTHLTLKKVEESLPEDKFSRVHKSFIVNNRRVAVIEGNLITMDDKSTVAIGTSYRESFLQKINEKLIKSGR